MRIRVLPWVLWWRCELYISSRDRDGRRVRVSCVHGFARGGSGIGSLFRVFKFWGPAFEVFRELDGFLEAEKVGI